MRDLPSGTLSPSAAQIAAVHGRGGHYHPASAMTRLTDEERALVLEALPEASTVAGRYELRYGNIRDWLGVAQLAICTRVRKKPAEMTIECWARGTAHFACRGLFRPRKGPHRFDGLTFSFNSLDTEAISGREISNTDLEEEESARAILAQLKERERSVLWRRYVCGESGASISRSMGVSECYFHKVRKQAIEKLRAQHEGKRSFWNR